MYSILWACFPIWKRGSYHFVYHRVQVTAIFTRVWEDLHSWSAFFSEPLPRILLSLPPCFCGTQPTFGEGNGYRGQENWGPSPHFPTGGYRIQPSQDGLTPAPATEALPLHHSWCLQAVCLFLTWKGLLWQGFPTHLFQASWPHFHCQV